MEREKNGVEHAEFPTAWRVMAQHAMEQLQPFGKTIDDATLHYVTYLKATERSCTAEALVEELLAAKKADGVGERQMETLKSRLGKFARHFDGALVATIKTKNIDDWLRSLSLSPLTRKHLRSAAFGAFAFAVRHGYALANPVENSAKVKLTRATPGILTVDQASALLVNSPWDMLPYFAIGLFAGLRRAELERLDWSEVDFESGLIEIKAAKAKTAMRRLVKIEPNLRQWLQPHRRLKGSVVPMETFRELFDQARTDAGITEWPENALRHSFASYHLAHFKNAAETALELGHVNAAVTFAHYRELVKPKEAARYWNLKPAAKSSRKIVSMNP
jgi:integrase